MGFAGQVFAARVAIGLAVPSPQALQKTGTMLVQFIEQLGQRIALKQNRGQISGKYKEELDKLNNWTQSGQERVQNEIQVRMKRHLTRMNTLVKGSMEKSGQILKNQLTNIRGALGTMTTGKALTQGIDASMSDMNVALQLAENVGNMTENQQRSAVRGLREYIDLQDKSNALEYQRLSKMDDLDPAYLEGKDTLATLEAENEARKDLLFTVEGLIAKKNSLLGEYSDLVVEGEKFRQMLLGTVDTIRNKFNTALRNTIAILTGLGYKLNQNAQELVDYERELLNANSVFGLTNDKLFEVGNTIIEFGNQYGIATQNGAAGLYQLASAGLEANEAMKVLPHTLKLSMAVQGDHNTISKLTAQTIFGFGMEMEQAADVTDKFAYAIQKSLIEYQDLSSAVKFALPFFTSTGQSLDQLLGALQILTNRALEAGIAGRGLRQALAEFAEGAMDAEAGFRKMGVEILNAEGEMMQLTEIASQFARAVGPETMSNTELLTTLIEDLNVRGATAFIHLVQASDEFTEAVEATTNAGGQLDQMVRIQNEALSAQLQILKTNIFSIFALRDASYEGTEYINAFHEAVVQSVEGFTGLIIETKNGKQSLTEFGKEIQTLSIAMVKGIVNVIMDLIRSIKTILPTLQKLWGVILVPLKIIAGILNSESALVQGLVKFYIYWKALTMLGIPTLLMQMGSLLKGMGLLGSGSMAARAHAGGMGMMFGVPGTAATKGLSYNAFRTSMAGKGMSRKAVLAAYHAQKGGTAAGMATKGLFGGPMGKMLGRGLGFAIPGLGAVMMAATAYQLYKAAGIDMGAEGGLLQAGGYVHGLQGGGSAMGGRPYLVGEQGPELFVPGASGQVLNNSQTQNMLGGNVILRDVTIGVDSFGGLA